MTWPICQCLSAWSSNWLVCEDGEGSQFASSDQDLAVDSLIPKFGCKAKICCVQPQVDLNLVSHPSTGHKNKVI